MLGEEGRAGLVVCGVTDASPSHAACARPTRCARGRLVACARSCDGGEGTGWRCESLSRRLCTPYQRVFVVPPPSPCSAMSVWGISLWSWPCFEYLVPTKYDFTLHVYQQRRSASGEVSSIKVGTQDSAYN